MSNEIELYDGIIAKKENYDAVMITIDIDQYKDWIEKGNNIIGFELYKQDLKKLLKLAKKEKK